MALVQSTGKPTRRHIRRLSSIKGEATAKAKILIGADKKKTNPAICNNILAVSKIKRRIDVKKDTTKSVRFGTMTILKTMGFSYEKNKFTFSQKKSLIDDTDKLKLKWKSIRTLVQKYPRTHSAPWGYTRRPDRTIEADLKGVPERELRHQDRA